MARPELSVVVPCCDEAGVIAATIGRIAGVASAGVATFEIVIVDDGSQDSTAGVVQDLMAERPWLRLVRLTRRFGHQAAATAGIDHATGQAVVLIDADLQDPPEVIASMLERWRAGYQVVYGRRRSRAGEGAFKLATARWFYRLLGRLSEVPIPLDVGDFRLMDRRVVEALSRMGERDRFLRGMVAWVGMNQCAIDYDRAPRAAGTTKYRLGRMVSLALDGILSFSIAPLRLSIALGLSAAALAVMGIAYALVLRLCTDVWVNGWTLLFIAVLFLGGVQLLCLGIVGEYVGRIYREGKRRPLYLVAEAHGFPGP